MMVTALSSETLVTTYQTTRRHNPGEPDINLHCRERLKSYSVSVLLLCSVLYQITSARRNDVNPYDKQT
jgi:hypothetical protein